MAALYRQIKAGSTDVSVTIQILDSTTGLPKTDVVYNSAGMALEYRRYGATSTAITEATLGAVNSAHSDGGFIHIGNGSYRLDLPDAACAVGVNEVLVHGTVTGGVIMPIVIPLVLVDFSATVTSIPELGIIDLGTAQAATSTTLQLRSALALTSDNVIGSIIHDVTTGQSGYVIDFDGTTDTVTVSPAWVTTPSGTGAYLLFAAPRAPTDSSSLPAVRVAAMDNDVLTDAAMAADTATAIATAVWNFATRILTAGTNIALAKGTGVTGFTDLSAADVRTAIGLASANLDTQLSTIDDFLDTEVAAVLAAVDTEIATIVTAVGTTIPAALTTIDDFLDTEVAAILADTNELQTDLANGGRLDLLIDAIKAKTDSLTFTVAGVVDSNVQRVNDVAIQGDGTLGNEWRPV